MSRIYDNWERLVEATLKREQLRDLAYCESFSSRASEFSFDSFREDVADESRSRNSSDSNEELRIPKESTIQVAAQTFTFRELAAATQNFRPEGLLGEDGFGQVYKGRLGSTGQVVAIKQLYRNSLEGNKELVVELLRLCSLRHPNIVNLIGYCVDGDQCLLVKEYMPLGSLNDHLHDLSLDEQPLDWNMRMKIAAGVAKGLEYLHTKVNPPVVHRDIKPSNILLDEGYFPKLSNLAIAKLVPDGNLSRPISTWLNWSLGYCAPEYAMTGQLTLKYDVYSFGVVLLELISGQKAINHTRDAGNGLLVEWARPLFNNRRNFPKMVDPLLQGRYPMRGLYQALAVASMCVQVRAAARPRIEDVVIALTNLASQTYDPSAPSTQSNQVGPSIQNK